MCQYNMCQYNMCQYNMCHVSGGSQFTAGHIVWPHYDGLDEMEQNGEIKYGQINRLRKRKIYIYLYDIEFKLKFNPIFLSFNFSCGWLKDMLPYGVLSLQAEEEAGGEVFHIVHTVDVLTVTIEIT